MRYHTLQIALNRTRLELKRLILENGKAAMQPLNRTRLELKLLVQVELRIGPASLNRTRLELKLLFAVLVIRPVVA